MNLEFLKRSRKIVAGDIFVFKMRGRGYGYGRVVATDGRIATFMENIIIAYFYDAASSQKEEIPELRKERLLIPPQMLDTTPWTKGFFETVYRGPLNAKDRLLRHCFREESSGTCFDEYSNEVRCAKPCGIWWVSGIDGGVKRGQGG